MKSLHRAVVVSLVVLGAWSTLSAQQTAAPAPAPAQPVVLETAAQYQGPAAEDFLKRAKVTKVKSIGTGVTLPEKATLVLDGVERFAAFKTIDEKRQGITQFQGSTPEMNFQDSWQTEIPAYVVDTIIGLGMVPATIERRINNRIGSLQWWVTSMMAEAERAKQKLDPPDKEAWEREVMKMRLFDQLIYNVDRHANNILITSDFHLRLIDHSRSFRAQVPLRNPEQLTKFSRSLLDGIAKLELQDLKRRVGRYLSESQIKTMLERRDLIVALAKKLVAERGEAAVIYP